MRFIITKIIRTGNKHYYARMRMMDRSEKRRHRRLGVQYNISCRKVGSTADISYDGHTDFKIVTAFRDEMTLVLFVIPDEDL